MAGFPMVLVFQIPSYTCLPFHVAGYSHEVTSTKVQQAHNFGLKAETPNIAGHSKTVVPAMDPAEAIETEDSHHQSSPVLILHVRRARHKRRRNCAHSSAQPETLLHPVNEPEAKTDLVSAL